MRQVRPWLIPSYFTSTIPVNYYRIVNHSFIYLIDVSDLRAVTETPIVFLHLFGILFCSALSYAFYLITAMILARDEPTTSRMETIGDIVLLLMRVITASFFSTIFLGAAVSGVFANIYYLGRRYLASPLVQFIVGFPGVRLIPYVHRKYWLPTTLSFLPRPRFFYLKRLIIRQSNLSHHFLNFYFLNYFLHRC